MGKINVLGFDIANLIAAGEVVDRPSSVVKELLENAIDAEASNITVEIKGGGSKLIRVTDDGVGIANDDLPLSVLRHATSKIYDFEDLAKICTLGFRGEALAAIASVTNMKIISKTADSDFGSAMTVKCGAISDLSETGCPNGTTVIVEDLFANVPARRKFLKKDSTETASVTGVVERIALSCPDISIKYITDGEVRFQTPGNSDLLGVIYVIYGKDISKRIKYIKRKENFITVEGYISEPDFFRPNRNMQNFFINSRYVKSRTMAAAVEQAYKTRIPSDKFPFCVLNMLIDPLVVDVNVHPSKLEVKFANEREVFESVYYAVLSGLEDRGTMPELEVPPHKPQSYDEEIKYEPVRNKSKWVTPEEAVELMNAFFTEKGEQISLDSERGSNDSQDGTYNRPDDSKADANSESKEIKVTPPFIKVDSKNSVAEADHTSNQQNEFVQQLSDVSSSANQSSDYDIEAEICEDKAPEYVIVGEAFNCYILVQLKDRLIFIDKHAAHERIIFDSLREKMKKKNKHTQMLMFPIEVAMTDNEIDALREFEEKIKAIGFDISIKEKTVDVLGIPEEISREACSDMLVHLASSLAESIGTIDSVGAEYFDARLYQASCKAAIKGGRIYASENLRWICDRILREPKDGESAIKTCPHGRPVAFELKRNSIERQFQRLV